ncbi:MAG: DUF3530 family protein [Pseudomonadales bacterium]
MRRHRTILTVCLLASFFAGHSYGQEQQHVLEVGQQRISASLYKSRKPPTLGGVVVLVAGGNSGAWPHSLHALGRHLPDDGWTTLRVDLKSAAPPTESSGNEQLFQQISAAVEFLRKDGLQDIVLVAAGGIAFQTLQGSKDKRIADLQGLVLLDVSEIERLPKHGLEIDGLKMPVLDLLTQHDSARGVAVQRKLLAQQNNMANYRQVRAPAVGPNWNKRRDPVVQRVRGWLRKNGRT